MSAPSFGLYTVLRSERLQAGSGVSKLLHRQKLTMYSCISFKTKGSSQSLEETLWLHTNERYLKGFEKMLTVIWGWYLYYFSIICNFVSK